MRFFHLADLHFGKTLNNFSLLEDQKEIVRQVLAAVDQWQPEAVVIAGDVYDKAVPSAGAMELFDDFLTGLASRGPTVLVIGGNHDSPERLAYAGRLLAERQIHLCGVVDGSMTQVVCRDAYGEVVFHLLPYVRPAQVRPFFPAQRLESHQEAVTAILTRASWCEFTEGRGDAGQGAVAGQGGVAGVRGRSISRPGRHVLVAHQFVKGSSGEPERSASEVVQAGGLDSVDAALFAPFDYVALGHLHGPQQVASPRIRYAGSPLKYSFSESLHQKSLTMVELSPTGEAEITLLPFTPLRDLRCLRGPLEELIRQGMASPGREDYLYITLTDEDEIQDPMARLRQVFPNVMQLDFDNARSRAQADFTWGEDQEEKSPAELFRLFYQEQNGQPCSARQDELISALWAGEDEE